MALFIFDFDHTIVNGHTHNMLMENMTDAVASSDELQWNLVKHLQPIGSSEKWLSLFKQLRDAGHQIAIASYGTYGKTIIPRYLRDVIGVPQEWLDQMPIQSWLPVDTNNNKNEHILQITNALRYKDYTQTIVLIDDSIDILLAAMKMGYSVIEATADAKHLQYAASMANMLNMKNGNINQFYTSIKKMPTSIALGNTLPDLINAASFGSLTAEKDDTSYAPKNFLVVANKNIKETATQYKLIKSFVLTTDCELYYVENSQVIDQYNLNRDAFIQCLKKHDLFSYLSKATEKPTSIIRHVSDDAMNDINELIIASISMQQQPLTPKGKY